MSLVVFVTHAKTGSPASPTHPQHPKINSEPVPPPPPFLDYLNARFKLIRTCHLCLLIISVLCYRICQSGDFQSGDFRVHYFTDPCSNSNSSAPLSGTGLALHLTDCNLTCLILRTCRTPPALITPNWDLNFVLNKWGKCTCLSATFSSTWVCFLLMLGQRRRLVFTLWHVASRQHCAGDTGCKADTERGCLLCEQMKNL